MKKLLLLALCLSVAHIYAQTWCPPGAEWTYNYYSNSVNGYQKLIYEKDTVVLSQSCKKISGYTVLPQSMAWGGPPTQIDTFPIAPIFTFSQSDTVYTFHNNTFQPTYFFNAQVGDTLPYYNFTGCDSAYTQVVDSIGTMVIQAETLRFYIAHNINPTGNLIYPASITVVERIGAINNFFVPDFSCFVDGDALSLRCYHDNNFATYQTEPVTACDYVFNNGIADLAMNTISIHPNPTTANLTLKNLESERIETIIIYNIQGQLQKQTTTDASTTLSTIDVSDLPDGAYVLQFVTSNGTITRQKFVKQTP